MVTYNYLEKQGNVIEPYPQYFKKIVQSYKKQIREMLRFITFYDPVFEIRF